MYVVLYDDLSSEGIRAIYCWGSDKVAVDQVLPRQEQGDLYGWWDNPVGVSPPPACLLIIVLPYSA